MKTSIKVKAFLMRSLLGPLRLKRLRAHNQFRCTGSPQKALSQEIIDEIEAVEYKGDNPRLRGSDKKIGTIGQR